VNLRVVILASWAQIDLRRQRCEATRLLSTDSAPLERKSPDDSQCGLVLADIDRVAEEQIKRVASRNAVREIVTDRTRRSREGSPCP
jgi:hypothetical protein